jgi:hypothetical protein
MKTENNTSWTTLQMRLKFIEESKLIATLILDNKKEINKNNYLF